MTVVEEKLGEWGHIVLIQAALHSGKVNVLIVSHCVPVVIEKCVGFLINETCKKINSIPQLIQGEIGEGEYLTEGVKIYEKEYVLKSLKPGTEVLGGP